MAEDITNVIRALDSNDTGERFRATKKLVEYGRDGLPTFLNVFTRDDASLSVKAAVVNILGHIGDEQTIILLAQFVTSGWQEPERINFTILERVPLALGLLVQARLYDPETQLNDPFINEAVNALTKSLLEKTMEYREGKFPARPDLAIAVHENITYRLNVIAAFKRIGNVNAIIDALNFVLNAPILLEEIAVLIAAVEALGWIGASPFFKEYYDKNKETYQSIERASPNKDYTIRILKSLIYNKDIYREVRITARNALKLVTGKTD
jgi:hypothetical protein